MKINIITQLTAALLLLVSATTVQAADNRTEAERSWENGISAYNNKEYAAAIDEFEDVLRRGYPSADLYYNLANAYFKLGQTSTKDGSFTGGNGELGCAVLNYHRALKLDPAMEDAAYNLKLAVDYTNDTEAVPQSVIGGVWSSVRDWFTSNTWTIISLVILAVTLALLLVYLLSQRVVLRKVSFFTGILLTILFVLTSWLAISQRSSQQSHDRAVIICNATTAVHASPDSGSKIIREPSQGVTITVTRTMSDWSEIMFADGEKGWITNDRIEYI